MMIVIVIVTGGINYSIMINHFSFKQDDLPNFNQKRKLKLVVGNMNLLKSNISATTDHIVKLLDTRLEHPK